jgi:N-formylglutamate deformylase
MKIVENTMSAYGIFDDEILNQYIFHIPHSSRNIPNTDLFIVERIENELNLLTDIATDKIFDVKNTTKLVFPYSRLFCDVERLPDNQEMMFTKGRGFYYTNTDDGQVLRILNEENKKYVFDNFFTKYHTTFFELVKQKLEKNNVVYIIDCHSFTNKPLKTDLIQDENRPDICLGVDSFHTPKFLVERFKSVFENYHYHVDINNPYIGTFVPLEYYNKNANVHSIMVEINRKLYMDGNTILDDQVKHLNSIILELVS